jgi:hypothetical protein
MAANEGVYIKSHVFTGDYSMSVENKPHIEVHLTASAKAKEHPKMKLLKAKDELSKLIEAVGQPT